MPWKAYQKRAKGVLPLAALFLVSAALLFSFGPVYGLGWHLLHGSSISYDAWRVPVPHLFIRRLQPQLRGDGGHRLHAKDDVFIE